MNILIAAENVFKVGFFFLTFSLYPVIIPVALKNNIESILKWKVTSFWNSQ